MGIAILWFVGFLVFLYLNGVSQDNDDRLRHIEERYREDNHITRQAAKVEKDGVKIDET